MSLDIRELQSIYDHRQSFYNKAKIIKEKGGIITLLSYNTKVAKVKDNGEEFSILIKEDDMSQTTGRHIKEFYKQYVNGGNDTFITEKGKEINITPKNLINHYGNKE